MARRKWGVEKPTKLMIIICLVGFSNSVQYNIVLKRHTKVMKGAYLLPPKPPELEAPIVPDS